MNEELILDTYIQLCFDTLDLPPKALKKLVQGDYIDVVAKYLRIGKKKVRNCLEKHKLYIPEYKNGKMGIMPGRYCRPSTELRIKSLERIVKAQAETINSLAGIIGYNKI